MITSAFTSQLLFELRIHRRRPFVWIAGALYFGLAFGDTLSSGLASQGYGLINSPGAIATRSIILSILSLLAVAGVVGDSLSRDRTRHTESLVLATGVGRVALGLARFIAAFLIVAATALLFIPGMILGTLIPGIPPELLGPFDLGHYLSAYLLFILPNLFFTSALVYLVASLTRSQAIAFGAAILTVALYMGARMMIGRDVLRHDVFPLYALFDPFGSIASAEFTMTWTLARANTEFTPFAGLLLQNRLLFGGLALVLVAVGTALLPLRPHVPAEGRKRRTMAGPLARLAAITRARWGPGLLWLQWELTDLWRSPVRLIALVFAALSTWMAASSAVTYVHSLPTTDLLVHTANYYFDKVLILIIAWMSGEVLWREHTRRVAPLLDALPTPARGRLLAKTLALLGLVLAFWLVALLVNVAYQLSHGFTDLELWLHVVDTLIFKAPYYLWMAVLANVLQVLIRRRLVAMAVFLAFAVSGLLFDALGLYHPVYRFAHTPFAWYSNMDGYGHFVGPHLVFVVYWSAFCVALWVLASLAYDPSAERRPLSTVLRERLRSRRARLMLLAPTSLWLLAGAYIVYASTVLHPYPLPDEDARFAEVERRYGDTWRDRPQPRVVAMDTTYELDPTERTVHVRGRLTLQNPHAAPISEVLVMANMGTSIDSLSWPPELAPSLVDDDLALNVRHIRFGNPLAPGAETHLDFTTHTAPPPGFAAHAQGDGIPEVGPVEVLGNGTSLLNLQLMPFVGYSDRVEHKPTWKRRRYGLPLEWTPPSGELAKNQGHATQSLDWVRSMKATVSTSLDQVPLHAGRIVDTRVEGDRRITRFESTGPSRGWSPILSARYEEYEVTRPGLPKVILYHHPLHDYTLEPMAQALLDALAFFQERWGDPPFETFRYAEQSLHYDGIGSRGGLAHSTEVLGWKTDLEASGGLDLLKYAGHLVGMSWFGDQLIPANLPGSKVIHAGLPIWSGALFVHHTLPPERSRKMRLDAMLEMFRARKALLDREEPFANEQKDSTMIQKKGALMMVGLSELVGPENLDRAIAGFLDAWRFRAAPYPTGEDFVSHLEKALPEKHRRFVRELFAQIMTWQLSVKGARCERTSTGYRVVVDVNTKQLESRGLGEETEIALSPEIQLGVFSDQSFASDTVLDLRFHKLEAGDSTVTLELAAPARAPTHVAIDPYLYLVDPNPHDNVRAVTCPP